MPKNCRVRPTNIFTAYHDAKTLVPVKARLLADCTNRGITFPSFADLKVPLYYGKPVATINPATLRHSTLEFILDLILVRPVDWLSAQEQIFADVATDDDGPLASKEILNFGPGYGVSKSEARGKRNIQIYDASTRPQASESAPEKTASSDDDIAIVGMAVDLPGAPDTESLWKVLRDEINTVSEVRIPCSANSQVPADAARSRNHVSMSMTSMIKGATKHWILKDHLGQNSVIL